MLKSSASQLAFFVTMFALVRGTTKDTTAPRIGLKIDKRDLTILINCVEILDIFIIVPFQQDITITLIRQHDDMIDLQPKVFTIYAATDEKKSIKVIGLKPGHLLLTASSVPHEPLLIEDLFWRITVANSLTLIYISQIIGWIYFTAWSLTFYPQLYINYIRKSVVGLSFDFMAVNIVGFSCYSVFNCCFYWHPVIRAEYTRRFPRGVNPVFLNDVGFAVHALVTTLVMTYQCFTYESAQQRVSKFGTAIVGSFCAVIVTSAILAAFGVMHWIDFLYYCSYIKLTSTIIKFIPQALLNYHRKSTVGWSIVAIFFDFIGGISSMLQMILNSYNYDDWRSIFGDPTKFGLGLFSVCFDVLFFTQHFVLYRNARQNPESSMTTAPNVA